MHLKLCAPYFDKLFVAIFAFHCCFGEFVLGEAARLYKHGSRIYGICIYQR